VKPKRFKRVLVANRGEIAVRIIRTLREMGITPVVVFSDADRLALHVRLSDLAYPIGPAPADQSYLRPDKILEVAKQAQVDAIHPGYGFLSENAAFAQTVMDAGVVFIGPKPDAIASMGSKTAARERMIAAGVPVVPGSGMLQDADQALTEAEKLGYPVMLKASAGGGGKGMRAVDKADDIPSALRAAQSEAQNAFGDGAVYMEKVILEPRHVEIQILSGPDGKALWLGERECSMQRRHQKVIEETPSPAINNATREAMGKVACQAAEAVGYVGAGTIEFLVDAEQNFYFLEMNTRLQVEHPITELCSGIDLVEAQVRIAQGERLPWRQEDLISKGHAMEARIYAEDPKQNFMPSPGVIKELLTPSGPGVRVDCGVSSGFEVSRYYDPMIAKIIVWAEDRERARRRLDRALSETAVKGLKTNTSFLRHLLSLEAFKSGSYHTGTTEKALRDGSKKPNDQVRDVAILASVVRRFRRDTIEARNASSQGPQQQSGWRTPIWRMRNS
jgi:acetyl-CoA carboxylase, biotin carboxylase subunit